MGPATSNRQVQLAIRRPAVHDMARMQRCLWLGLDGVSLSRWAWVWAWVWASRC